MRPTGAEVWGELQAVIAGPIDAFGVIRFVSEIVLGTPPHNDIGERWGARPCGSAFTRPAR